MQLNTDLINMAELKSKLSDLNGLVKIEGLYNRSLTFTYNADKNCYVDLTFSKSVSNYDFLIVGVNDNGYGTYHLMMINYAFSHYRWWNFGYKCNQYIDLHPKTGDMSTTLQWQMQIASNDAYSGQQTTGSINIFGIKIVGF